MGYYLRRTAQAVITFVTGLFATYALYRLMPGGPLQAIIRSIIEEKRKNNEQINPNQIRESVASLSGINPDQGIIMGFVDYAGGIIFHADFGQSIVYQDPVFDVLFRAMPWSILISTYGLILGFTATIFVGTLMAWKEGTKIDSGLTLFVLLMNGIPYYIGAIFMLIVFGFQWGLFPTGGRYSTALEPGFSIPFMISIAHHAALPILSGFIVGFAGGSLSIRGLSIRIIGSDFLRSAEIRGVGTNRILSRYLMRNTILPVYTGFMMGISAIFSSSVITEKIFQYPGVGWYLFQGLTLQDYPLIMGSFVFFTGLTILGLFIADLTYGLIDPRAGSPAEREAY